MSYLNYKENTLCSLYCDDGSTAGFSSSLNLCLHGKAHVAMVCAPGSVVV